MTEEITPVYCVVIPETPKKDILVIASYIKKVLNAPIAAQNTVNRIEEQIQKLEFFPLRHPQYLNKYWDSEPVRFISVNNFIIFYIVKDKERTVIIYRVAYGRVNTEKHI